MQKSPHLLGFPHTLWVLTQLIRTAPFKTGPAGLGPPPFVFFYHKVGPTGLNAEVEFSYGFAQRNDASIINAISATFSNIPASKMQPLPGGIVS